MRTNDGGQAWGDKRQETETCSCLLPPLDWLQEVKGDQSSQEDKMSVESSKKKSQMCNHTSTEIFRQQRFQDLEADASEADGSRRRVQRSI